MTKEEIRKILDNTKVYVNGKSKEIQEKLFSFGYGWSNSGNSGKIITHTDKPFLFIYSDKTITYGNDMDQFIRNVRKEITAEEILSIELTEPSYRPFKTKEECWNEMLKHQPFGWIKHKYEYIQILCIYKGEIKCHSEVDYYNCTIAFAHVLEQGYTFIDGTPFGIKEE